MCTLLMDLVECLIVDLCQQQKVVGFLGRANTEHYTTQHRLLLRFLAINDDTGTKFVDVTLG